MARVGILHPMTLDDDVFATTRWTVVLAAKGKDDLAAKSALEFLCSTYWFPLYAYVRRRGFSKEDAEDLTQAFLAQFLGTDSLHGVAADKGKFRAYLLASLKHYLANDWDRTNRLKRGGGDEHLSLDWATADSQFQLAAGGPTPEQAFDREWALALLESVLGRLQHESQVAGKGDLFLHLKIYLTADRGDLPQAQVAKAIGMEEAALRVAVHRLRKRYRELLRKEILQTLSDPGQLEEEMRTLLGAFAR